MLYSEDGYIVNSLNRNCNIEHNLRVGIVSGRMMTIGCKFEVNVRNEADKAISNSNRK